MSDEAAVGASESGPSIEGELIDPATPPVISRPPGRKPVAALHVIPPLSAEEISMLIADPNEVIRRRMGDYLNWAHALVSTSPSRLNRVAFGVESQRRMVDKLLSLAIPPARVVGDQFGDMRQTPDSELIAMLQSLGPDPALALRPAPETETRKDQEETH
jgi:hypothetical protein